MMCNSWRASFIANRKGNASLNSRSPPLGPFVLSCMNSIFVVGPRKMLFLLANSVSKKMM